MIKLRFKQIMLCAYKALVDTIQHDGIEHAGYLSFLSLLSLFPFLVFFVAIAGTIGQSETGLQLVKLLLENNLLPEDLKSTLEPRVHEIVSGPPQGLLTLAIAGAIWTASSAVEGLRTILNRAYRVETPPAYIFRRLLSILQFLVLTVGLIFAMSLLVLAPIAWYAVDAKLHITELFGPVWVYVRYALVYGFTAFMLLAVVGSMYYILPNIKQNLSVVVPGAIMVVVLWMITGTLFSYYLRTFDQVNIIYGSLGGIIVSLLFFYIMSMILVYGAEFNYLLNRSMGKKLQPREVVKHH